MEEIVAIEKKLLSSLSFTRYVNSDAGSLSLMGKLSYGSLYIVDDAFPGCEKAEIASDASQSQRKEVESFFLIGPVSNNDFWDKERASLGIDRGPCETRYSPSNVIFSQTCLQESAPKITSRQ